MSDFTFIAYQCISRPSLHLGESWFVNSTKENPIQWTMKYEFRAEPFPIAVAQLRGANPSIGAWEYFDVELDEYLKDRWPVCLIAEGTVKNAPDKNPLNALDFAKRLLWLNYLKFPIDQRSVEVGYRREYATRQDLGMNGRRPNSSESFVETIVGDPIGPGLVTISDFSSEHDPIELIWSDILKFPNRTSYAHDRSAVQEAIDRRQHHFNSHSELRDSFKHLANLDHKAAVRSAASAVETAYLFCREEKKIKLPKSAVNKSFDEKLETVLALASLPSFAKLEPAHAQAIRYLYRARNSMHYGECSYKGDSGKKIKVRHVDQVASWVRSAQVFILWLDSIL